MLAGLLVLVATLLSLAVCTDAQPYTTLVESLNPFAIAVNAAGDLFIGSGPGSSIVQFSSTGQEVATFNFTSSRTLTNPKLTSPTTLDFAALAIAPNDQLWAVDGYNLVLYDFTSTTAPLTSAVSVVGPVGEAFAIAFQPGAASSDPWVIFPADPNPIQQVSGTTGAVLNTVNASTGNLSTYAFFSLGLDTAGNLYLGAGYPGELFFFYPPYNEFFTESDPDPTGLQLHLIKLSPNGTVLYNTQLVNPELYSRITSVVVTQSGSDVYVSSQSGLFHVSGDSGTLLDSVVLPQTEPGTVAYMNILDMVLSPTTGDLLTVSYAAVVGEISTTDLSVLGSFTVNTSAIQIDPLIVAVSPTTGIVYVMDDEPLGAIEKFAPDGTDLGPFQYYNATTGVPSFTSMVCDAQGNVYIPIYTNQTTGEGVVQKFSPDAVLLQTFSDPTAALYFGSYNLLAVSLASGILAVQNGVAPNTYDCVIVFWAADGTVINRITAPGNQCATGGFTSTDNFAFVDFSNETVVVLSPTTGDIINQISYPGWYPFWMFVTPDDRIFVEDGSVNQVIEFNLQGDVLSIPVAGSLNLAPNTIAYSPLKELLYVASSTLVAVVAFPAGPPASSTVLGGTRHHNSLRACRSITYSLSAGRITHALLCLLFDCVTRSVCAQTLSSSACVASRSRCTASTVRCTLSSHPPPPP